MKKYFKKIYFLFFIFFIFANIVYGAILPQPQKIKSTGKQFSLKSPIDVVINLADGKQDLLLSPLKEILTSKGINKINFVSENKIKSSTLIFLGKVNYPPFKKYFQNTNWKIIGDQGYRLLIKKINQKVFIICFANKSRGVFYGLQTLRQIIIFKKNIAEVDITDYPSFTVRGIIEGGYGGPWEHLERMKILKFMAENKMNAYLYGPKGDKLIRDTWRTMYPEDKLKVLKEEVDFAKKNFIEYGYVLSPVKNVQYSSENSFKRIIKKYEQLYEIGIRNFAIFFDDILEVLAPQDQKVFKNFAEAHTYITNKVYAYFKQKDKSVKFSFCPTHYSGLKDTYYLQTVKLTLNKDIIVGWTGPDICAHEITSAQTIKFLKIVQGQVGIGDNYPVAGSWGLGPLRNRSKDLYKYVTGFTANPLAGKPEASKLALYTVADYSWNSESYNPDKSFNLALQKFSNAKVFPYLKIFTEHFSWAPTDFQKPANLKVLRDKFWEQYLKGKLNKKLLQEIINQFKMAQKAKPEIETNLNNVTFIKEMEEPLNKFQQYADSGLKFFLELKNKSLSPDKKQREELKDKIENTLLEFVKAEIRLE